MRLAGIGFRDDAGLDSVLDALAQIGAADLPLLALPARKEGHPVAHALQEMGRRLIFIPDAALAATETVTQSPIARRAYGTGSVAEAAALAACGARGHGARLIHERVISGDRLATAALAEAGDKE